MIFHKSPPHWYDEVKDMAPNTKQRVSDSAVVTFNGEEFFYYDHREKEGERFKLELTLAQKLEMMQARQAHEQAAAESFALPPGLEMDPSLWPVAARCWLYKAHFNNHQIRERLGAGWHEGMQRVFLPLQLLSGAMAWNARAEPAPRGTPKYLTPRGMVRGGGAVCCPGDSDIMVLTEDYLSTVRIAHAAGVHSLALLGTTLTPMEQIAVVDSYRLVILWLDPDRAGVTGQNRLWREMGRFDKPLRRVTSDVDPKKLTDETIRSLIQV